MFYRRKAGAPVKKKKPIEYKGIIMASAGEKRLAMWMDDNKIPWEYEPDKLPWQPPARKYEPDFKIGDMYIEYKGYFRPEDRTKMRAIKKQYPELDIRFVFENASKTLTKKSKTTYAQWAEKLGFPWTEKTIPKEWL